MKKGTNVSYWCDVHKHRILHPHLQCPSRIIKALKLYPKCILCNLEGTEIEGLRLRMGWSKREMARKLDIPWQTYQAITDFRRSGTRSELHQRMEDLIEKILENPTMYVKPQLIKELTVSPLDFFNRYIGSFPWQDEGKYAPPVWPKQVATKKPLQPYVQAENSLREAWGSGFKG